MNILEVVNVSLAGGVLHVAIEQARNLTMLGHRTALLSNLYIPYTSEFFGKDVHIVHTFKTPLPGFASHYLYGFLRELTGRLGVFNKNFVKKYMPNWIICHDLRAAPIAHKICSETGAKLAIVMHSINYPPSPIRYIMDLMGYSSKFYIEQARSLLKKSDLLLAMMHDNVRLVKQTFGLDALPLPYGSNPLDKVPNVKRDYILYFGRLSLGKGVHRIARAVALADRNAKVVFAGSIHSTTRALIRRIKQTGLKNYTILFNVSKDMKNKLFLHARMVVYWRSEMDFLVPACYGVPIVTHRKRYAGEVFIDGVHGRILESENEEDLIEEFANAIHELLTDERKARTIGYNAWLLVRRKYTWRHHVEKLLEYIGTIDSG